MRDNDFEESQMASVGIALEPDPNSRLGGAIAALSHLTDPAGLRDVLWARMGGPATTHQLPRMSRDERPADVLVDIVELDPSSQLADRIRAACTDLLSVFAHAPELPDAAAISELCYLSARVGADKAVDSLRVLAERPDAVVAAIPGGGDLHLRALRSLVGLIGLHRDRHCTDTYRRFLLACLAHPGCELLALTALIGLWPEDRAEFESKVQAGYRLDANLLDVSLEVAGLR